MHNLDNIDRCILRQLQQDADMTMSNLSGLCGVSATPCWRRIERLKQAGIIEGPKVVIDWKLLGYTVEVSLRVTLDKTDRNAFDRFIQAAKDIPEITTIETFLGRVDVRLTVVAHDLSNYQSIYREKILLLPFIQDIEALMLVSDIKNTNGLPI